jgi:hypothetical protein
MGLPSSHEKAKNLDKAINDPYWFLTNCVYTLDQVDSKNPIKLFPQKDYLRFYINLWRKSNLIAVPKTRRMTMSWTNIALYLWDTMFHPGRFNAFVSKKEEHAKDLVEKAEFIYRHLPGDVLPLDALPKIKDGKMKVKPPVLEFAEIESKIQGFPMGQDQLRQFTFSGILGDESAFWPDAESFYSASKPTLDGGGRMTLISSPAPGFFKKIVFDTFNSDIDLAMPPKDAKVHQLMQGMRVWNNPQNRFTVVELHYTADPGKRNASFKEMLIGTLPRRKYLQEYELNWDSFEGLPVYADFSPEHIAPYKLDAQLGLPLLCGWDFGLTPSCVVGQLQGNRLVILNEFVAKNKPISEFAPLVMNQLKVIYPEWYDPEKDFRHWIDPSGNFRKDTDANTCMKEMRKQGLRKIFPGDVTWEARREAVEHFLTRRDKDGPLFRINETQCPVMIRGFRGGYLYPESANEIEPTKLRPLKNEYSHPHDALQYLCGGILKQGLLRRGSVDIPSPSYGFQKNTVQKEVKVYG